MTQVIEAAKASGWGTPNWFSERLRDANADDPSGYYSHDRNGYQVFRHRNLARMLWRTLGKKRDVTSLLDVGCGTGAFTWRLAKLLTPKQTVGVDFSEPVVDKARGKFPEITFRVNALPQLEFESDSFDIVVASEVLYYLDQDARVAALRDIARVLRPGGRLLFTAKLGGRYFSQEAALELVGASLRIEKTWSFHNQLYLNLMKPSHALRALCDFSSRGTVPRNPRLATFARRHSRILGAPLSRKLLKASVPVGNRLFLSKLLPAACHHLSRWTLPTLTRSNIVIIARKKD